MGVLAWTEKRELSLVVQVELACFKELEAFCCKIIKSIHGSATDEFHWPLGSLGLVYAAHGLVSKKYGQNLIILQPLNRVMEEELHSGKLLGAWNSY